MTARTPAKPAAVPTTLAGQMGAVLDRLERYLNGTTSYEPTVQMRKLIARVAELEQAASERAR